MNQEEILRALEICTNEDGISCDACPRKDVFRCVYYLVLDAKELILSLLAEKKDCVMKNKEPEPWTRQRVLSEAEKCVCGQREQDYGTPEDSFNLIAKLWTTYVSTGSIVDLVFDAKDVAAMMAPLKIDRIAENPQHMDSWVDLAGYAACGGEIAGKGCCNG